MEHLFQRRPGWVKGDVQYQQGGGVGEDAAMPARAAEATAGNRAGLTAREPGGARSWVGVPN
jgi:hypothetical protein